MARTKKQAELAGMERPTNKKLDALVEKHLESSNAAAEAKETAKQDKAALKAAMEEEKDNLEKDEDENHVYVHQDGDERTVVVLYHEEGIRCRKDKKPALSVVTDDGEID